MQPFPDFKQYRNTNVSTAENVQGTAKRCFFHIYPEKLKLLGEGAYIFDCLIDGERRVWCAPIPLILAYVEAGCLRFIRKNATANHGHPCEVYVNHLSGQVFATHSKDDSTPLFQLSQVRDGKLYSTLFKSL